MKLALAYTAITLTACALIDKPNNSTALISGQIVSMAERIEQAQSVGTLSESTGDNYLKSLSDAHALLIDARATVSGVAGCQDTDTKYQCIDRVLAEIEGKL
jgi:hypothetical protein